MVISSDRLIALAGVWEPSPVSSLPALTAFSHVWMVPSGIPNSLAALAPPISLASFTACTLYSWPYFRATLNTSLFSWFYYEILENKLSTFFIPHQTINDNLCILAHHPIEIECAFINFAFLFIFFHLKLLQKFGPKTPFFPDFAPKTPKKLFLKLNLQNPQNPSNTALLRAFFYSKFLLTPRALHRRS